MDEREFEQNVSRLMKQDFSAGTEAFRDALLVRCLDELGTAEDGVELDDGFLDMLAAAGDMFANAPERYNDPSNSCF